MREIMEIVLTAGISFVTQTYNLLPKIHLENSHRLNIKRIIYYSFEKINIAWNENKMISLFRINAFVTYSNIFL